MMGDSQLEAPYHGNEIPNEFDECDDRGFDAARDDAMEVNK